MHAGARPCLIYKIGCGKNRYSKFQSEITYPTLISSESGSAWLLLNPTHVVRLD